MNPISNNLFCSPSLSALTSDGRGDPHWMNYPQTSLCCQLYVLCCNLCYIITLLQASSIMCLKSLSFFCWFLITVFRFEILVLQQIQSDDAVLSYHWLHIKEVWKKRMLLWSLFSTSSTCFYIIHDHILVLEDKVCLYIHGDRRDRPWWI